MIRSVLLSSFAAGALALGLAACDQAPDNPDGNAVPMQQQGAVPQSNSAPAMQSPSSAPTMDQPGTAGSGSQ